MSDFQYMVECTTRDLINILVERDGMEMQEAIDLVYTSNTFRHLQDEHTGLYFQSPLYVYETLMEERKRNALTLHAAQDAP